MLLVFGTELVQGHGDAGLLGAAARSRVDHLPLNRMEVGEGSLLLLVHGQISEATSWR